METNNIAYEMLKESIAPLKKTLTEEPWWQYVQEEVKKELLWVIDHLPQTYELFATTFYWSFMWECLRKNINQEPGALTIEQAAACLNHPVMSEQSYRCGMQPVEMTLKLEDWTRANDADVYACLVLRHKILGLIQAFASLHETIMKGMSEESEGDSKPDEETSV